MTIRPRVHIVTTGGTIAGRSDVTGTVAPGLSPNELLARVPAISSAALVTAERLLEVPSHVITFREMLALARRAKAALDDPNVSGVVVTHGTATLEQTAYFLDTVLGEEPPIVVTGAMRNPTLPSDDGR
jgi:L-asparaginase